MTGPSGKMGLGKLGARWGPPMDWRASDNTFLNNLHELIEFNYFNWIERVRRLRDSPRVGGHQNPPVSPLPPESNIIRLIQFIESIELLELTKKQLI